MPLAIEIRRRMAVERTYLVPVGTSIPKLLYDTFMAEAKLRGIPMTQVLRERLIESAAPEKEFL